jgi:Tfp pilus assembly protein PilO
MKDKLISLETQIALMQSDIHTIRNREPDLPIWLKNSAVVVLFAMFTQIMTSVWWAASMTTQLENITQEVGQNTEFRVEYPKMHAEMMVSLKEIQVNDVHTEKMLKEIKNKLRFVDIKSQIPGDIK